MSMEKTFKYTALDERGKTIKGTESGANEESIYGKLKSQGLTVQSISRYSDSVMQTEINIPGFQKKAKLKSLAVFARQFALLIKTGITIPESLEIVAQQTDDKILQEALEEVHDDIERGMTLSEAMAKHPLAFPQLMVAIVNVGESGGFLDRSMESMADSYKIDLELRQKIKSAMTYPVLVFIVVVIVLIAMLVFVVPQFEEMFTSMGADLPVPTQMLVTLSNNMVTILPISGGILLVLFLVYSKFKNEEWLRSRVDLFKLKMPVFGSLNLKISIARFSRNLSMMLNAGVPMTEAFRLVSDTANNWVISNSIEMVIRDIELGKSFSESIEHLEVFPTMVKRLISVGERSGSMSIMLDQAADFYDDEVREASDSLSASIEPIMIMVLGGVVGGMLIALYLPMFGMMSLMSEA